MDKIRGNETQERLERPLDFNQVLFRQIERVNSSRTKDILNDTLQFNIWVGCIQQLTALLEPFKDNEWCDNVEKLQREVREEKEKLEGANLEFLKREAKKSELFEKFWRSVFTECILLMQRKGLLLYNEGAGEL